MADQSVLKKLASSRSTYLNPDQRTWPSSGLPISPQMARDLDGIKERVLENNFAGMIVIDGGVGQGKTTLAIHCADYIMQKEIDFETQLAMGGAEFNKKLGRCYEKNLPVIIYDEAGDFNRRSVLTRFNQELNRVFETYRAFKIIPILVLPSIMDLDDNMFKKQIPRWLYHVYNRKKNFGNVRCYSVKLLYNMKYMMKTYIVKPMVYGKLKPNHIGQFYDLYPKRRELLTECTVAGKLKILDKSKAALSNLEPEIDTAGIQGKYGFGYTRTRSLIKKFNIQPVYTEGLRLFYNRQEVYDKFNAFQRGRKKK